MYILDKNKDFYDYYSHIYGEDKSITFDRRGSVLCTGDMIVGSERNTHHHWGEKTNTAFRILEVGYIQYLIKVYDIVFLNDFNRQIYGKLQSYKMVIQHVYRNNEHLYKTPISIHGMEAEWNYNAIEWIIPPRPVEDDKFTPIELPILADTVLTKLISPEEIWKELSNYISSLKNDKNVDIGTTDIEKVVNHGFDKKESFRGGK